MLKEVIVSAFVLLSSHQEDKRLEFGTFGVRPNSEHSVYLDEHFLSYQYSNHYGELTVPLPSGQHTVSYLPVHFIPGEEPIGRPHDLSGDPYRESLSQDNWDLYK